MVFGRRIGLFYHLALSSEIPSSKVSVSLAFQNLFIFIIFWTRGKRTGRGYSANIGSIRALYYFHGTSNIFWVWWFIKPKCWNWSDFTGGRGNESCILSMNIEFGEENKNR